MIQRVLHVSGTGRGFRIPTPQEVVNNATSFVSNGQTLISSILTPHSYLLFPFMNFTCNSTITRLMFVARLSNNWETQLRFDTSYNISKWPQFFLWRRNNDHFYDMYYNIGPFSHNQLLNLHVQAPETESMGTSTDNQIGLIEVNLTAPVEFKEGDILGLRIRMEQHVESTESPASPTQRSVNQVITVLGQRRGYGLTLFCNQNGWPCNEPSQVNVHREDQQMPYIAIETGKYACL